MKAVILRRRKLGLTSCREISRLSKTGITFIRNDKPFPNDAELVIRWGCTTPVGLKDAQTLNKSEAIHWVADKATSRKIMADAGLSPKTWLFFDDWANDEGDEFPFVVRKRVHSQGKNLDFCKNGEQVKAACAKYGEGNYYISEFIPKVAEYRVCVVSGRVAWVAKKTPADPNAIAWNVAQGGRFDNVRFGDWPLEAVRVAIEAFNLSGLDFGGVDVMVDADGKAYVLEINSAPSLTSPYRQECMAKAFDYIVENGKEHIPVVSYDDWKDVAHPSISEKVRVNGEKEE